MVRAAFPGGPEVVMEAPTIQTELKIARSYLGEAEAKLNAKADYIFTLGRRVARAPVPVTTAFTYGAFFGAPPATPRDAAPLDIGTLPEYRQWLEQTAGPIFRDLQAAVERLRKLDGQYPGAALIVDGAPAWTARAMLAYAYLLLGDYFYYRCNWDEAGKNYRAAFKLEPTSQEGIFRLGVTLVNQGDMGKARNFLERAVELGPSTDVAVEAHKQLERLAQLGPRQKAFMGSSSALKWMIGISIAGLLVCLSCICCGLIGGWSQLQNQAPDIGSAAAWTIISVVIGGLIFLVPAVITAVYYFTKRK